MLFLHGVDGFTHLLRRALLVGIDWPQVALFQPVVAGQIENAPSLVTSQRFSTGSFASSAFSGAIVWRIFSL